MANNSQKGVSLYLVIIVMSVVLAIVFGTSTILLKQVKMARGMEDSVMAYYAAETGLEEALKDIIKDGAVDLPEYPHLVNLTEDSFYEVKAVCCAGANCIFSGETGGSCPGLGYSCPEGMKDDENCDSPSYCIISRGNYKGTERVIEVKYGLSELINYDYFYCSGSMLGSVYIGKWNVWGSVHGKFSQMFKADQDYNSSAVQLKLRKVGNLKINGIPIDLKISIQGVANDSGYGYGSVLNCYDLDEEDYDGSPIYDYPDGNKICEATLSTSEVSGSWREEIIAWDDECSFEADDYYFLVIEDDVEDDSERIYGDKLYIRTGLTDIVNAPTCNIVETPCEGDYMEDLGGEIEDLYGKVWQCRGDCYDEGVAKESIIFTLWRCPI